MPLFVDDKTGEGVYIEPIPHQGVRRRQAEANRRLELSCLWLDYHHKGLSLRTIAELVHEPVATVEDGIRTARAHLAGRLQLRRSTYVAHLTPMFGADPGWGPDRERGDAASCPVCGGHVEHETFICAGCQTVAAANQARLDRQLADALAAERRQSANQEAERAERRRQAAIHAAACRAAKRRGLPRPERAARAPLTRTYRFGSAG